MRIDIITVVPGLLESPFQYSIVARAIKKGLTNTANAALDDYAGNVVDVYAGYVFDFKSIKDEMNAIEGKGSPAGGRVSLSRFMDGLIAYYNNVK